MFSSSIKSGLDSSVVEKLRAHYGTNHVPSPPGPSILSMLISQVTDFIIIILIVVAIIDFAIHEYDAGIALFVVVIINGTIGFWQEYKANKALEALMSLTVPKATVIRDGKSSSISADQLVPGDLVVLEEGDLIPADLRLCEVSQLEVVEIILTGESLPVSKSVRTIRKRVISPQLYLLDTKVAFG